MRRIRIRLTRLIVEETWLFASLIKWTLLASTVGVLAGCATALFLTMLGCPPPTWRRRPTVSSGFLSASWALTSS
jgi:hypothetical protein